MNKLFGTDGIRARVGEFPLDSATVPAIGQAIGMELSGEIVVGQDPRASSPWILENLEKGLFRTEASIINVGIGPTPAIALLTQQTNAAGGIMISASHNAYEDNGIKIFASNGHKLSDECEERLENRIRNFLQERNPERTPNPVSFVIPKLVRSELLDKYEALLACKFPPGLWLQDITLAVDCANGAMSELAPDLLQRMGAKVITINANPSGTNINENCGALHPESLVDVVKKENADIGVAFDGDGDRSIFVTGNGRLIDGDPILLLLGRLMKKEGRLTPAKVIGTLMTNYSLERTFANEGIELQRSAVGDRYVFQEMIETGSLLGGEPSGHIIFPDFRLSGDGLLTTLKVCEALIKQSRSLDDLTADWTPTPQLIKNIPAEMKLPLTAMPSVQSEIIEIEKKLEGRGRLIIRYSGTEPLLRIMIESDSSDQNEALVAGLIKKVKEELPQSRQTSTNKG